MEEFISYFSMIALILVLILLVWAIILMYDQRARKVTARSRLAQLRKKIEDLPESSDEEKNKKELLHKELNFEYLDNILGEIEKIQIILAKKGKESGRSPLKRKKKS
jgi:biopolymer transport protein ExbB/TolQ